MATVPMGFGGAGQTTPQVVFHRVEKSGQDFEGFPTAPPQYAFFEIYAVHRRPRNRLNPRAIQSNVTKRFFDFFLWKSNR